MNKEILDDELTGRNPKKEEKDFRIQTIFAVVLSAFAYLFILIIFTTSIEIKNVVHYTIIEDSLSIVHLIMAMAYMNFIVNEGNYKLNIKAGYYILILGSGFFFIGAAIAAIEGLYRYISAGLSLEWYWSGNYSHIITLIVILIKFLLIKPIAFILSKISKYVSEES